jgi:hypothetical protein
MGRKETERPKHEEVYQQIKAYFLEESQEGDILPGEVELAQKYHVGRGTVRVALKRLVDEGIIIRKAGKGTFLAPGRVIQLRGYHVGVILSRKEFSNQRAWEYSWYNNMEILNGMYHQALECNMRLELIPEEAISRADVDQYDGFLFFRHIEDRARSLIESKGIEVHYKVDIQQGLQQIVEHSLSTGCTHPAYIGSLKDFRVEHIDEVLNHYGFAPIPAEKIQYCDGTREAALAAVERLLQYSDLSDIDCVYCSTDVRAAAVLEYCASHQIAVPDQLSVYGFDGSKIGRTTQPPLTTCAFNWNYFGAFAVSQLRSMLDGTASGHMEIQKGSMIERTSTLKPRYTPDRLKNSIAELTNMGKSANVQTVDDRLKRIHRHFGLSSAIDALMGWSTQVGYIDMESLEKNEFFTCYDHEYNINFQVQLNYSRLLYAANQHTTNEPDQEREIACHICKSQAGTPEKELLRIYSLQLADRGWFLQLTPYPLYPKHIVVIDDRHIPMDISRYMIRAISDFVTMAPSYTVCSNSDRAWAGASILDHLHFQSVEQLRLPIFEARPVTDQEVISDGITIQWLHYPLPSLRVSGYERRKLEDKVERVIKAWKKLEEGNTCNLVHRSNNGRLEWYLMFRNPRYRNPSHLNHIKTEGIGVIEAAGAWIFPPPKSERLHKKIIAERTSIIRDFFEAITPEPLLEHTVKMQLLQSVMENVYE